MSTESGTEHVQQELRYEAIADFPEVLPLTMIINFWGNLKELLRPPFLGVKRVEYELSRQASVKDIVESCGVPHTEVGRLTANGRDISFSCPGSNEDSLDVYPLCPPVDVLTPTLLRPEPLAGITFAVDVNVGKLASLLRMAGFDTFYQNYISDPELIEVAVQEKRIVLSRDKPLFKNNYYDSLSLTA